MRRDDNDTGELPRRRPHIDGVRRRALSVQFKPVIKQNLNELREFHARAAIGNEAAEPESSCLLRLCQIDQSSRRVQSRVVRKGVDRVKSIMR